MRYPHDAFPQDWSLTAGYGFGDKTSYGYHEAIDVNDKQGGNHDLGLPIYAEADGKIVLIHNHTTGFGKHYFLEVVGPWGTRYFHHAHCLEIYVAPGQKVKEGDLIARIGNSGTTYAHDHWACAKAITNENVANTLDELNNLWENPVEFVEKWKSVIINPPMDADKARGIEKLDQYRKDRKQGAEGSYEGFVNAVISSDKDIIGKEADLTSAKAKIVELEANLEIKDEAFNSLKVQLEIAQDALKKATQSTGKVYKNPVALFFIKLADFAEQ